jgi:hypothetical protein
MAMQEDTSSYSKKVRQRLTPRRDEQLRERAVADAVDGARPGAGTFEAIARGRVHLRRQHLWAVDVPDEANIDYVYDILEKGTGRVFGTLMRATLATIFVRTASGTETFP